DAGRPGRLSHLRAVEDLLDIRCRGPDRRRPRCAPSGVVHDALTFRQPCLYRAHGRDAASSTLAMSAPHRDGRGTRAVSEQFGRMSAMGRASGPIFRIKLYLRRFARRHPLFTAIVRSLMIFSAAFGGAYGFIAGSTSPVAGYDPHAFAIGASFLFAVACVWIVTLGIRLRLVRRKLRGIAMHNEAMADRNWELQEAESRARSLFESQGDLIVLRDAEGRITFANDAYCELAGQSRDKLVGSQATLAVIEQGDTALELNGTRVHDQKIETAFGPRWIAWR